MYLNYQLEMTNYCMSMVRAVFTVFRARTYKVVAVIDKVVLICKLQHLLVHDNECIPLHSRQKLSAPTRKMNSTCLS